MIYLFARVQHSNLTTTNDPSQLKLLKSFPLIKAQWTSIAQFRDRILSSSRFLLAEQAISDDATLDALCSIALLEDPKAETVGLAPLSFPLACKLPRSPCRQLRPLSLPHSCFAAFYCAASRRAAVSTSSSGPGCTGNSLLPADTRHCLQCRSHVPPDVGAVLQTIPRQLHGRQVAAAGRQPTASHVRRRLGRADEAF